jgi:hypothetical protein
MDKDEATRRLIGDPAFHNLLDIKQTDRENVRLAHKILVLAAVLLIVLTVDLLVH